MLKRMLAPNNMAIRRLSQEEGISEATLHKWPAEARGRGQILPGADAGPEGWSSRDKFAVVLETAALNEADLAEYCRKRGVFAAQIKAWRGACEQANDWARTGIGTSTARLSQAAKAEKKRIKDPERELARKDRALAETAALLVLGKKLGAIWGDARSGLPDRTVRWTVRSKERTEPLRRAGSTHDQHPTSPNRHAADRRGRHRWRPPRQSLH